MNGWMGTILRVDLTSGTITKEPLEEDIAHKYIGGRALNIKILFDETKPGIDPLGPENKLIFGAGPCNGTLVPGSSRLTLTAKSPITGFFGCSNGGGSFGAKIKYAGYDAIVIEGKAETPVFLWINDDNVEFRDASQLWGKTAQQTRRALQKEVGRADAAVLCIGPAGENLVRFAAVMSDFGRAHGKTGMGAVMGAKNLKAVAVTGTKGVRVAHPRQVEEAAKELLQDWRENDEMFNNFHKYGTAFYEQGLNEEWGSLPVRNWQEGCWDSCKPLYKENVSDYFIKQKGCFSCFLACDHIYGISKGEFSKTFGTSLQAGNIEWFGANIGVNDLQIVARASALCNEYGLDIVEMGNVISMAMECFEKGVLTEKDMDGLRLDWGNSDSALKLIDMTTYRKGIGNIFAEGIKRASETIGKGAEKYAMHVKGLALDAVDPRGQKGWGLCYAVAGRGADHGFGMVNVEFGIGGWDPIRGECWDGKKVDPLLEEGKAAIFKWYEDAVAFQNLMQVCIYLHEFAFAPKIGKLKMAAKLYNAVTGLNIVDEDVMHIGERTINLEHAYNIREGWTRKDDTLPERFLKEPMPEGPSKGQVVKLEPMIDEYYLLRGWDKEGLPTKVKLVDLGLEEAASKLEILRKLG